jgi:hypothetical protein
MAMATAVATGVAVAGETGLAGRHPVCHHRRNGTSLRHDTEHHSVSQGGQGRSAAVNDSGKGAPTRADLVIAVYRHQVEACAEAGPALLAAGPTPHAALARWVDLFVDFLVTKHGLAAAMQGDGAGFEKLHAHFLERLLPVCAQLLDAAAASGEIKSDLDAYHLMRGIGNLCIGAESDPQYEARRLVAVLVAGLRQPGV